MRLVARAVSLLPASWIRSVSAARWRWPWLRPLLDKVAGQIRGQDGVIQHGLGKGLKFNPGSSNPGFLLGTSEPAIQEVIRDQIRPGMTVWDGGANVGFLAVLAARQVGPTGKVVCFEPLPANATQIEHNIRLNGFEPVVSVRREAIGGQDGSATLLVLPEPNRCMLAEAGFAKGGEEVVERIEVPVRSLDSLAAEGMPRPDVIKLDIEGAEGDALAGGRTLLREARPILLVELHDTNAAVAAVLDELDYHAAVIGSDGPVAKAHWNAYVVAVPRERTDLARAVDAFCAASAEAR